MPFGFEQREREKKMGERAIENRFKKYVEVICCFTIDGKILPLRIIWDKDYVFEVDRILDVRNAASTKVGGLGIRYYVKIRNRDTYLFFDTFEWKWFVEAKDAYLE